MFHVETRILFPFLGKRETVANSLLFLSEEVGGQPGPARGGGGGAPLDAPLRPGGA